MIDYVFELPHNNPFSGGVYHTLNIAAEMDNTRVRFQRITRRGIFSGDIPPLVGLPDNAFPECKYAITYSDTPYLDRLLQLPQVGKVAVLMLSYGMAIERERKNVRMEGVTVLTSTRRNQRYIESNEGVGCYRVGFGFDPSLFQNPPRVERERVAILYAHPSPEKRFDLAVRVAIELCQEGTLDGFRTFGHDATEFVRGGGDEVYLKYHRGHTPDATSNELCYIFNRCSVFIMPSITEGLNRTPAEATLCGCPSVLSDGARDELYFPDVNCKWVERDNYPALLSGARDILAHDYSKAWAEDMMERVGPYTFRAVAERIREVMEEGTNNV